LVEKLKIKLQNFAGGGGGIGRAIAVHFARAGAAVVVTDLNKNNAHATCESLPKGCGFLHKFWIPKKFNFSVKNVTHSSIHCDVSGENFVQQLQEFVHVKYKTAPNILVNNAGEIFWKQKILRNLRKFRHYYGCASASNGRRAVRLGHGDEFAIRLSHDTHFLAGNDRCETAVGVDYKHFQLGWV
jgi:NAD(P)-dependent dehydrogenase (short-subunit alcohol dehydrogenase family)